MPGLGHRCAALQVMAGKHTGQERGLDSGHQATGVGGWGPGHMVSDRILGTTSTPSRHHRLPHPVHPQV